MLFYTGTTLAAAMYIVGAVEIVLVRNYLKYKNIQLVITYIYICQIIDIYGTVGIHIWRFHKGRRSHVQ